MGLESPIWGLFSPILPSGVPDGTVRPPDRPIRRPPRGSRWRGTARARPAGARAQTSGHPTRAPGPPRRAGRPLDSPSRFLKTLQCATAVRCASRFAVSGRCAAILGGFGQNAGMADVNDIEKLEWKTLVSGHLEAAAWKDGLYVRFSNGSVYRYDAPESELAGLVNAMSAGSYLKGRIERRWPGTRVV